MSTVTDDQLQAITFDHERRVDDFIKAREALEESARLVIAASAAAAYPTIRWAILQDSDQSDGLWIDTVILDDGEEPESFREGELDDWADAAASDIRTRDDLTDLGQGFYALEVWPEIDRWTGA